MSLDQMDPEQRADGALLASNERFGIVPLDAAKEPRFSEIRANDAFDLVIGNPPYVSETGNKVLFDRLRALPGWRGEVIGKGDYLYYFLALAAEKVAPGGRVCVITPAGWMNAGNASWLRERLASTLRLDELYLFGSMRLFATEAEERDVRVGLTPPLVESAILVATKAPVARRHHLRVVVLEDAAAAAAEITGDPLARTPPRESLLELMATRAARRAGRSKGILVHSVRQDQLRSARPWPIKHASGDVAARVVAHLETRLEDPTDSIERLEEKWKVERGIETGADAYTARIQRRLSDQTRSELARNGARTGDPILELPAGSEQQTPWSTSPQFLARTPAPEAVLYGAVDDKDYSNLVYLRRDDTAPPDVVAALEPWREVLRTRAEFRRNTDRSWWETAWPRKREMLWGPKVISLHRTDRGRFSLDELGEWQPSNKMTIVSPRSLGRSLVYLCGLLNSELLDLWYAARGRTPRDIWRDYEPKPMYEMPYRDVPTPGGWFPSSEVDGLADALANGEIGRGVSHARSLLAGIGSPTGDADAAAGIEHLVRAVASNRRALLRFRTIAPELKQVVKRPWRTHGVTIDRQALLSELAPSDLRSVRLDATLTAAIHTDGVLGRVELTERALKFHRARRLTARIDGPHDRLALLLDVVVGQRLTPDDLLSVMLPASPKRFSEHLATCQEEVDNLLAAGRELVEAVERLVCGLYGLPGELTELVIDSASTRAGTVESADD